MLYTPASKDTSPASWDSIVKIEVVIASLSMRSASQICLRQACPKSRESKKSVKDAEFSPSRHRKDIVMVSKLRKYIGNPSLMRKAADSQKPSCTEIALAHMRLEHAPKRNNFFVVVLEKRTS